RLRAMRVPVVGVSNWRARSTFPSVLPDDAAIGRMAAKYLLDLGLRHLGVIGLEQAYFSTLRCGSFVQALAKEEILADVFGSRLCPMPAGKSVPPGIGVPLAAWLLTMPKPAGAFAAHDAHRAA